MGVGVVLLRSFWEIGVTRLNLGSSVSGQRVILARMNLPGIVHG